MKTQSAASHLFSSNSMLSYCDAAFYAFRTGKFREMLYFAVLEAYYWWCYILRIRSRLIEFKPTPFLRCSSEHPLDVPDLAAMLRLCSLSAIKLPIKWCGITETANGTIFGTIHDRPNVLFRSDNLWSKPIELFEFSKPIMSVFISSSNHLFVSTQGAVYVSANGGSQFGAVLQLSHCDSFVWHNHGIDETPEGLVVGEYGIIVNRERNSIFLEVGCALILDARRWQELAPHRLSCTKLRKQACPFGEILAAFCPIACYRWR